MTFLQCNKAKTSSDYPIYFFLFKVNYLVKNPAIINTHQ